MIEPPTNVRIIDHDDVQHPVEVAYRGVDEDGQHIWVATTHWVGLPKGIAADKLPAHTAITVEFTP